MFKWTSESQRKTKADSVLKIKTYQACINQNLKSFYKVLLYIKESKYFPNHQVKWLSFKQEAKEVPLLLYYMNIIIRHLLFLS